MKFVAEDTAVVDHQRRTEKSKACYVSREEARWMAWAVNESLREQRRKFLVTFNSKNLRRVAIMKKLHWTLFGIAACLMAWVAIYNVSSTSPQSGTRTVPGAINASQSIGKHGVDGAAEYRGNVAISANRIDEQNPLRSYKPLPGMAGRISLEEMHGKGVPATPQSATLALGLLRRGRLSSDENCNGFHSCWSA